MKVQAEESHYDFGYCPSEGWRRSVENTTREGCDILWKIECMHFKDYFFNTFFKVD